MLDDLKLAVRWLQKSPAFAITAIITLALAIGANAAIFSIADAVLFRPLPYEKPDRLLTVRMEKRETGERSRLVPNTLVEVVSNSHSGVGEVARIESGPSVVHDPGSGATFVETSAVTANYFQVVGVRPYRGRAFAAVEYGGATAAMLSFRAWRERFGGQDSLVGRPLKLGNQTFDIVGILPPGFVFPSPFESTPELVTVLQGSIGRNPNRLPSSVSVFPVVRLEPRVSLAQAQSELEALHAASGGSSDGTIPRFEPVRSALTQTGGPIVRYLLAGSLLLLLLGCANLANLLLARGQRRMRETGVRAALGASRVAIVRPVLIESALIGLLGAAAAVIMARAAFAAMVDSVPPEAYLGADVGVDARVLGFTLLLGVLASIAFGIAPSWLAARVDAVELIQRRHARGHSRSLAGSSLVVVQVAVAIVLVFGASITGRAFITLLREPIGFDPERVVTVSFSPVFVARSEPLQQLTLRMIDEVRQVSGVVSAGATSSLPRLRASGWAAVFRPGTQDEIATQFHVLPGYFEAAGIRFLSGRDVTMDEARSGAPVAVVSAQAARAIFGGQDPLGAAFVDGSKRAVTVVGVVGNVHHDIGGQNLPPVYVPTAQAIRLGVLNLVIKTRQREAAIAEAVRQRVLAMLPGAVVNVAWWSDRINALEEYRNPRFQSMVLGSFAVVALALMALGVFGVVSVMVATRTRDIGIRLAIGSTPGESVRHAVAACLVPVAIGVAAGLVATRWLSDLAESQLYQVQSGDPAVLALTSTLVLIAGFVAAWIPARRAGRVDPVMVLRSE